MLSKKNIVAIAKYLAIFLKNIEDIDIDKGLDELHIYSFQGIRQISDEVFGNRQYLANFITNVQDYIQSNSVIQEDSEIDCDFFITFLYNIFLGRKPKNQSVIQPDADTTIKQIISTLFYSQEFLEKTAKSFEIEYKSPNYNKEKTAKSFEIEYKSQNYNKENILIIGNCQAEQLFKIFSIFQIKFNVFVLSVRLIKNLNESFKDNYLVKNIFQKYKFILTQELFDEKKFGKLITANLCSLLPEKIVTFPNIYFLGLHPDLAGFKTYLSPFRDHHSSIALKLHYNKITGQSNNLSKNIKDCIDSLKKEQIFTSSFSELMNRDKQWDVKIFDFISNNLTSLPLLLTINHPTTLLITEIARRIINHLELNQNSYSLPSSEFIFIDFIHESIWPIYDEIHQHFGLQYVAPKVFQCNVLYKYSFSIEEFINLSMDKYSEIKDEEFVATYNELRIAEDFY